MASALKRKRGPVEVTETLKRAKSVKISEQEYLPTPKLSQSGWEAAFNPPTKTKALVRSGVNGNEANGHREDSPVAIEFNDLKEIVSEEKRQRKSAHEEKQEKKLLKSFSKPKVEAWHTSDPIGGRMINVDPVFTADEKFLIVASRTAINVYSTSTSLLTRSIKLQIDFAARPNARIITYCLSPTDPNLIWVACSDGAIYGIDWTSGAGADQYWGISSTGCIHMTVASMESAGRRRDVVFTTEVRKDGGWRITANELAAPNGPIETVARTIYTSTQKVNFLKTAKEGSVIVGSSGSRVIIGVLRSTDFDTVDKIRYEFRVFESTDPISSLDLKVSDRPQEQNIKKPKRFPVVDVVVGDVKGAIFLHNDLWANLVGAQKGTPGISLAPRKLHWHRQAVHTVKWSLDGNYIISGGTETVLVLWQLDTGKHQYLPHMGSTIQNVVVSPTGTSYGVQLADNSTMVLSTATLKPTANIAGIQSCILDYEDSLESSVRRIEEETLESSIFQRTPAMISPTDPSRLLLGVGQLQETSHSKPLVTSSPFLQTFDLGSGHSISRQALTRTNITNITETSSAHKISEPRVTHMQLSFNGKWLATVDEWAPPKRDVDFIGHQGIDLDDERRHRRQVYLKFWQWIEEQQTWELVSRIDNPHASEDSIGAPRILDLAADPSSQCFSTIGEDGLVRTWTTKIRKRDGVIVRGKDGSAFRNWSCRHAISIGKPQLSSSSPLEPTKNGSIAFSEDGSLLAAACGSDNGLLHLLDPELGTIRQTRTRMYAGHILKVAFLAQDLITLSDRILVYDLILDELRYSIKLQPTITSFSVTQKMEMLHLALDRKSRTFAVALPGSLQTQFQVGEEEGGKLKLENMYSELAIFDPDRREPLLQETFSALVTALLPAVGSEGYLVLDSAAEIRTVLKKGAQAVTTLAQSTAALNLDPVDDAPVSVQEENEDEEMEDVEKEEVEIPEDEDDDVETPVVTRQQLAAVFDVGPAFALPPLEDMFYQVVNLFSSQPLPHRSKALEG